VAKVLGNLSTLTFDSDLSGLDTECNIAGDLNPGGGQNISHFAYIFFIK